MKVSEHIMMEEGLPVFKTQEIRTAQVGDIAQACSILAQELKSQTNSKRNMASTIANIYAPAIQFLYKITQVLPPTAATGPAELFFILLEGWLQNSKNKARSS